MGPAIGGRTEAADVVLMRSYPLDVSVAPRNGRGTVRKEQQNLGWAIGYNTVALPIAAGVFAPAFGPSSPQWRSGPEMVPPVPAPGQHHGAGQVHGRRSR